MARFKINRERHRGCDEVSYPERKRPRINTDPEEPLSTSERASSSVITVQPQKEEVRTCGSQRDAKTSVTQSAELKTERIWSSWRPVKRPNSQISFESMGGQTPSLEKKRRISRDWEDRVMEMSSTSAESSSNRTSSDLWGKRIHGARPDLNTPEGRTTRQVLFTNRKRRELLNLPPTERKTPERQKAKIWIIGSSYIRRAEAEAQEIFGDNFGLNAKVQWFGKGGLRWGGVLPRFYEELSTQSPPDILIIHAGGNDLGQIAARELASIMERDLLHLHRKFPSMRIAFSAINERQAWRYGQPGKVNRDRKLVNACMRRAAVDFGGEVIEHQGLKFYKKNIFLPDGVHFTKEGNHIFLHSIHATLTSILQTSSPRERL